MRHELGNTDQFTKKSERFRDSRWKNEGALNRAGNLDHEGGSGGVVDWDLSLSSIRLSILDDSSSI